MARPRKKGQLDWFKHSTFWDEKMEALLEECRAEGGFVMETLWMQAYRTEDGILDLSSPLVMKSIARKAYSTVEAVERTISVAIEVGLFDRYPWESSRILSSHAVSKRLLDTEDKRDQERSRKDDELDNSGKTPENSGKLGNKPENVVFRNSSPLLSSDLISSELEKEGLGGKTLPEPTEPVLELGPAGGVRMTQRELDRVKASWKGKGFTESEFDRGLELLEAQLAVPGYAKKNRSHAACMVRWVPNAVTEEKLAKARLQRASGPPSTAGPPSRSLSVTEHNEDFFRRRAEKRENERRADRNTFEVTSFSVSDAKSD